MTVYTHHNLGYSDQHPLIHNGISDLPFLYINQSLMNVCMKVWDTIVCTLIQLIWYSSFSCTKNSQLLQQIDAKIVYHQHSCIWMRYQRLMVKC